MLVSIVSLLVRLFVTMFFVPLVCLLCLLPKCFLVSVSLSLFVSLFGCYSTPVIIFAKCLYCYCQFSFCDTIVVFVNHHPSYFILLIHPSIGGEFKTLRLSGMVHPYPSVVWVSRLR